MTEERKNTIAEIQRMKQSGAIQVSMEEMKTMLKSKFGLNLKIGGKYTLKYYNTSNENHYLECTDSPTDETGHAWCNIKSKFYHNKKILKEYQKFRQDYFSVLPSGHILSI